MHVLNVRNVHEALPEAIHYLLNNSVIRESRNGEVLVSPQPVTTLYRSPRERVLFWELRDANPFHNVMEGLWMLAGRNDVEWPARFAKGMRRYSDDGLHLHGAYGHRWRTSFNFDQLRLIFERLKVDKTCRRQVLQIWDPALDGHDQAGMRDLPCNLTVTFQISPLGCLDIVVFSRSNDLVWGTYGADAVHFSMLQEYMASRIGVPPGLYWQVSVNFHAYRKTFDPIVSIANHRRMPPYFGAIDRLNPYVGMEQPTPLVGGTDPEAWDAELKVFLDEGALTGYRVDYIRRVAVPMLSAHDAYKAGELDIALGHCSRIGSADLRRACSEWIQRRIDRRREAGL